MQPGQREVRGLSADGQTERALWFASGDGRTAEPCFEGVESQKNAAVLAQEMEQNPRLRSDEHQENRCTNESGELGACQARQPVQTCQEAEARVSSSPPYDNRGKHSQGAVAKHRCPSHRGRVQLSEAVTVWPP